MAEAGATKKGGAAGTTVSVKDNIVLETIPHGGLEIVACLS